MSNRPGSSNANTQEQSCEEESEYEFPDFEPRYDPKELRDAAKILTPFLRLIEDTNNPYARIVAQELCKTYYRLFHPGTHPVDVIKSIDWNLKFQRTNQLWNEFWQYVPGGRIKEWSTLKLKPLIEFDVSCEPIQPQDTRRQSTGPSSSLPYRCRNEGTCAPAGFNCGHQAAGSDQPALSNALGSEPDTACTPASFKNEDKTDRKDHVAELDSNKISDEILTSRNGVEQTIDATEKKCCTSKQYDTSNRQVAGNDNVYRLPHCSPGCSSYPVEWSDHPSQYEYYRVTANSPPPGTPLNQEQRVTRDVDYNDTFYDDIENVSDFDDDFNDGCDGNAYDDDDIACDYDFIDDEVPGGTKEITAAVVANAFTNLALAEQNVQKKKTAFDVLTQNYLEIARKPNEDEPLCAENLTDQQIIEVIHENPPKILRPFDDCEWNDNAFRDRDFVRLLPFFEIFHSQLEYITAKQREFGLDMLDDIMSVLYHMHYDLGDPRLKNDMLIEHARLITKNTWEQYFYNGDNQMPLIPELPPIPRSPPPVDVEQPCTLQPTGLGSPQSGLGEPQSGLGSPQLDPSQRRSSVPPPPLPQPKKTPPAKVKPAPKAPVHKRPTGQGTSSQGTSDQSNKKFVFKAKPAPKSTYSRPRTAGTSAQGTRDTPQIPEEPCAAPTVPERK